MAKVRQDIKEDFATLIRMFHATRSTKNRSALKTAIQSMEMLSRSQSPDEFLDAPRDISIWKRKDW